MEKVEQLGLPYMEFQKVAGRDLVRKQAQNGRSTYWVEIERLAIRDGFNIRKKYEKIEDLALFIEFNGVPGGPLTVDMMPDGDHICYIEIGHRRYKALQLLLQKIGCDISHLDLPGLRNGRVECFVNDTNVTELTRLKRQYTSNNGEKYSAVEIGELCLRMHEYFNLSYTDIARELGKSRQQVKNMIDLAKQSPEVKAAVNNNKISATTAVQLANVLHDKDKVTEMVQESVSSGKVITGTDVKKLEGEDAEGNIKGKRDKDGEVYDESRMEIKLIQNAIKNVDRLNTLASKVENEQFKIDFDKTVGWIQKDLAEIRTWIKKNKKN